MYVTGSDSVPGQEVYRKAAVRTIKIISNFFFTFFSFVLMDSYKEVKHKSAVLMMKIESKPGKGTKITTTFKLEHIDRKPLGNLNETIKCLKITHPEINISFNHIK